MDDKFIYILDDDNKVKLLTNKFGDSTNQKPIEISIKSTAGEGGKDEWDLREEKITSPPIFFHFKSTDRTRQNTLVEKHCCF